MNINKRVSLLLAAFLAVSSLASCGDTSDQGGETTPSGDTTSAEVKEEYTFSKAYDGQEIRVLNCDDIFSMHARVDTQETTGDALNDAQYNAVRKLESYGHHMDRNKRPSSERASGDDHPADSLGRRRV